MRVVFVFLRDAAEDQVARFLSRAYPFQEGPPWIIDVAGDPCVYIHFYRAAGKDFEPRTWSRVVASLGTEPPVGLAADVSGRHPGDPELLAFVRAILGRFEGVAVDEYTDHCWKLDEIISGMRVQEHPFFDYRGWARVNP